MFFTGRCWFTDEDKKPGRLVRYTKEKGRDLPAVIKKYAPAAYENFGYIGVIAGMQMKTVSAVTGLVKMGLGKETFNHFVSRLMTDEKRSAIEYRLKDMLCSYIDENVDINTIHVFVRRYGYKYIEKMFSDYPLGCIMGDKFVSAVADNVSGGLAKYLTYESSYEAAGKVFDFLHVMGDHTIREIPAMAAADPYGFRPMAEHFIRSVSETMFPALPVFTDFGQVLANIYRSGHEEYGYDKNYDKRHERIETVKQVAFGIAVTAVVGAAAAGAGIYITKKLAGSAKRRVLTAGAGTGARLLRRLMQ